MAKLTAIELGKTLKKEFNHSIINLMPTNLYGPNDNFSEMSSHVIPGLIHKMHIQKIRKNICIWGTVATEEFLLLMIYQKLFYLLMKII